MVGMMQSLGAMPTAGPGAGGERAGRELGADAA